MSERPKDGGDNLMQGVVKTTLGSGLMNAMVAKQGCVEKGMDFEADVFEDSIQTFRTKISEAGLDPDEVIKERVELLKKALGE